VRNQGLGSWPARRAMMSPDRPALEFAGEVLTYREIYARVSRLATRLMEIGIGPGDRVAYLGANHRAFVETMFATFQRGAIFVPLNFRLTAPEVDFMLRDSGSVVLVHAAELSPVVAALSCRDELRFTAVVDAGDAIEFERWVEAAAEDTSDVEVGLDDVAMILYTSGTTGRPKGTMLTHGNLLWNTFNIMVGVDVASDEVTLISAPLFHVAALNQTLLPTFIKGACSVILPRFDVDEVYDAIERHGVTWMFGVTTMFAAVAQSPRWAEADLSSLRTLMSGGAAIPATLIQTYQSRGLTFCQGYGLTETAPGATFLEARESVEKVGSAGVPAFFTDVRVVRPDGSPAEPGEPGEVWIRGRNVTPGYWRDPDSTAAAFADGGWFRSGDVATVDTGGHVYIVDRLKDMFISGGENVYPAEVEAALFGHSAVAEVAVVGIPDEKWGEVGKAYIVTRPGQHVTAADLVAYARERLASYKVPKQIDLLDELPRTGSGKVQKGELRALAARVSAPPSDAVRQATADPAAPSGSPAQPARPDLRR
jgi:fatty-acyl-CoA synthase